MTETGNGTQITSYTTWWQQYNYDALNRLDWVREISNGAEIWKQDFTYDRYGNRTIDQTNTWGPATGAAINKKNFTVNTTNNRLGVPAGQSGTMSYDNAGNLTTDTCSGAAITRVYDAENRMTSETQAGSFVAGSYTYNADGQRVRRTVGGQPSAVTTWQVYGFSGELLAEYAASAAPATPQKEYGYRNGQLLITAEPALAGAPVNLALNKLTTQSSTYIYGDPTPNLAVDGNTDGVWLNHSVASTNNEAQAWWQVDLGSTTAVSSVEVWNRTDCCPERLSNFNVMLLDANQATVASVSVTGPGGTPTTVAVSGAARYVKVQLAGTNFLSLAEVKVWSTAAAAANINWLVTDQLGTPRMIFDKTGSLAGVSRHDYLPFGEEIFVGTGGRTSAQGYSVADGVRQKFTSKERDNETGLDYFGARYYASTQGRFTGADPYDINFERQETADPQEANALFTAYIGQPQHWNHYSYALNNPLKYIDPDGLYEYEVTVLGQTVKVHIDDDIIKGKPEVLKRIQDNLQKAFDKINAGANDLTQDQIESIHSQNRINVSNYNPNATVGGTFYITQRTAENPNIDTLSADIIHDSRHSEQFARGLSYNEKTAIPMETEASQFAVDVMDKMGGFNADVRAGYQDDAKTGHFLRGSGWKDKSTPKSRAKVSETMQKPQKRRN